MASGKDVANIICIVFLFQGNYTLKFYHLWYSLLSEYLTFLLFLVTFKLDPFQSELLYN